MMVISQDHYPHQLITQLKKEGSYSCFLVPDYSLNPNPQSSEFLDVKR